MNVKVILLCVVLFVVGVGCLRVLRSLPQTYVSESRIQGDGLFANQRFKQGDIILDDIFPYRTPDMILRDKVPPTVFQDIISYEGSKINHCSTQMNSTVVSDDFRKLQLVATQDILPDDEITANYNTVHKQFPFIAKAGKSYTSC